jgi:hypothetical protein
VVKDNSLVVATHGRSMWTFDHLSVIRELSSQAVASPLHLFSAPDAIRWRFHGGPKDKWAGDNPPARAVFYYWLKEAPKGDIVVEVLDSQDRVVKKLSSKPVTPPGHNDNLAEAEEAAKKAALPKEAGVQMGAWDLSYDGAEMIQDAKLDAGNPTNGPLALPGVYSLKLTVDGKTATTRLKVLPDPRAQMSEADLKAQFDLANSIREDISRLTRLARQLRSVRGQLASRNELLKDQSSAAELIRASTELMTKLGDIESRLQNPKAEVVYDILAMRGGAKLYSRMSALYDAATDSDGAPTQGVRDVYADQRRELDGYESTVKRVFESDLTPLNALAKKLELPTVVVTGR